LFTLVNYYLFLESAKKLNLLKKNQIARRLITLKLYVVKINHLVRQFTSYFNLSKLNFCSILSSTSCSFYTAVKKQNVYKCADCKYQTPRKSDLKKHLKRHMGICDYYCSYCERKFFDKYNLERHVNTSHTKIQQFSCTLVMYKSAIYFSNLYIMLPF